MQKLMAMTPIVMKELEHFYVGNKITNYSKNACLDVDALLLITEWLEFKIPSCKAIGKLLDNKVAFDCRNIYIKNYV